MIDTKSGEERTTMKLAVKKVYCTNCQKLQRVKEENNNGATRFTCTECKNAVWIKDNLTWHHFGEAD